jgi:hypothetical protein
MARFTLVDDAQAKATLARDFIELADDLRDLLTQFGLRSYRVSTLRIQWSGGKRGKGTPTIVEERPILPTPKITALDGLLGVIQNVGLDETGSLEVSQISGTYSEDQLRGFDSDGTGIPPDQEFLWEVEFFPTEGPSKKRRFFPKTAPNYKAGALQWTIRLEKANDDRSRNGEVYGAHGLNPGGT